MTRTLASPAPCLRWWEVAGHPVASVLRKISALVTALRHRQAMRSLAALDDHALKDIGLMRSDVDRILGEPLARWFDPVNAIQSLGGSSLSERSAPRSCRGMHGC
jgi:uncharacterized protein YjiS (DUF1127 family)